jgi:glycosyltransferase involved in cell wall biosynthesis
MRKILFYSDSPDFGGHEAMTVAAVECLSGHPDLEISFLFYEGNHRLRLQLEQLPRSASPVSLHPIQFKSERLEVLRCLAGSPKVRKIASVMRTIAPDVALVSQGRIEGGSAGLLAAKRAGLRTISYIPMAHPAWFSGKRIPGLIREAANRYIYSLPDKFITISETARRMLLARGANADIAVVSNCVDPLEIGADTRRNFRERHGLASDDYAVAIVGRIDFRQKGQDFALRAIAEFQNRLRNFKFLFVGEGPDEQVLRNMIAVRGLQRQVLLMPWQHDRSELYGGIDMLLIPSKYEGVPLVMLEAMLCRLKIVASNVDGMAERLPSRWLFPYGDAEALVRTVVGAREEARPEILDEHRSLIQREYSVERFGAQFLRAVLA